MRHPSINPRKQTSSVLKWTPKFLRNGLTAVFRNKLICTDAEVSDHSTFNPHYDQWMLCGGTMVDVIWAASEKEPENKHVLGVKARGVGGVIRIKKEVM